MKLRHSSISIPSAQAWLDALLCHAPNVQALALIVQPWATPPGAERENTLTHALHAAGFGTLTVDLLTAHEQARDPDACFNVPQLALRIDGVRDWIAHQPMLGTLQVGLLASGTACAAAIRAAARHPEHYSALVCLGGRADLAGTKPLTSLVTPTLFAVDEQDPDLPILRQAYAHLVCQRSWQPVATTDDHLDACGAARLAVDWLLRHPRAPATDAEAITSAH